MPAALAAAQARGPTLGRRSGRRPATLGCVPPQDNESITKTQQRMYRVVRAINAMRPRPQVGQRGAGAAGGAPGGCAPAGPTGRVQPAGTRGVSTRRGAAQCATMAPSQPRPPAWPQPALCGGDVASTDPPSAPPSRPLAALRSWRCLEATWCTTGCTTCGMRWASARPAWLRSSTRASTVGGVGGAGRRLRGRAGGRAGTSEGGGRAGGRARQRVGRLWLGVACPSRRPAGRAPSACAHAAPLPPAGFTIARDLLQDLEAPKLFMWGK